MVADCGPLVISTCAVPSADSICPVMVVEEPLLCTEISKYAVDVYTIPATPVLFTEMVNGPLVLSPTAVKCSGRESAYVMGT